MQFNIIATFKDPCECCEYRQWKITKDELRVGQGTLGHGRKWGLWRTSRVTGTFPEGWVEDVDADGDAYGHRPDKHYSADGCKFEDTDGPGSYGVSDQLSGLLGSGVIQYRFHKKFRAGIIDAPACKPQLLEKEQVFERKCAIEFEYPFTRPWTKFRYIPYDPF